MFVETATPKESSAGTEPVSDAQAAKIDVINRVLEEIRPNLQRDGGDCQFVKLDGNKVMVRLSGACVMCKLSSMTLEGIQGKLIEELGEFVRCVPVMGGISI